MASARRGAEKGGGEAMIVFGLFGATATEA